MGSPVRAEFRLSAVRRFRKIWSHVVVESSRQPNFGNMKRPMAGADLPGSQFGMRRRVLAADPSAWHRAMLTLPYKKRDSAVPPPALDS
jgi:hypothetical protein